MSLKFLFLCNVSVGYFSFSQSLAGGGCDVSNCSLFKRKLSWPRSGPRRRRDFTLSMLGGELLSRWENSRLSADWQTTRTRVNQTRTVSYFLSKIYKTNWVINFSLSCKLSGIFSVLGKVFVTLNSNDTGLQVQQSLLEKDKKHISGIATVSSWERKKEFWCPVSWLLLFRWTGSSGEERLQEDQHQDWWTEELLGPGEEDQVRHPERGEAAVVLLVRHHSGLPQHLRKISVQLRFVSM